MITPLISVIIPVYNGEHFLKKTLNSAINQTCQKKEILIIDDGSTDSTKEIIKRFKNIRYFKRKHLGLSSTRNYGIRKARGEYIAFLDGDDILEKDKLSEQIKVFLNSTDKNLGVVYCNTLDIDENDNLLTNFPYSILLNKDHKGFIYQRLLEDNVISGSASSVLIKRECFNKVGYFDKNLKSLEDWDMWIRIAKEYNFNYINEPLVKIRRHADNMSKNKERMILSQAQMLDKVLLSDGILTFGSLRKLRFAVLAQLIRDLLKQNFYRDLKLTCSKKMIDKLFDSYFLITLSLLDLFFHVVFKKIPRVIKNKII